MGANLSAEEEVIVKLLIQLLIKRGVNFDPYKVKLLLKFLQKNGARSTVLVMFDVKTWENAGTTTWDAASRGDKTAAEVMMTWHLVTETLRSWQVEKPVQTAAAQATQAGEIKSGDCLLPEKANLDRLGNRGGHDTPNPWRPLRARCHCDHQRCHHCHPQGQRHCLWEIPLTPEIVGNIFREKQ